MLCKTVSPLTIRRKVISGRYFLSLAQCFSSAPPFLAFKFVDNTPVTQIYDSHQLSNAREVVLIVFLHFEESTFKFDFSSKAIERDSLVFPLVRVEDGSGF